MFCCLRTCLNGSVRKPTSSNRGRDLEISLDESAIAPDVILLSRQTRITGSGGALGTAPLVQSKSYFEVKIQQSGCWSIGLGTRQADLTKKFGGNDKETWCLCSDNATRHNNEVFRPVVTTTNKSTSNTCVNGLPCVDDVASTAGLIGIEDLSDDNFTSASKTSICNIEASKENISIETINQQRDFPDEGDIVGVSFDHIELNFYFNGKNLEIPFRNVKGTVYPLLYVGNGAILDIILDNFNHGPPPGFDKIMLEQSLL